MNFEHVTYLVLQAKKVESLKQMAKSQQGFALHKCFFPLIN